MDTTTYVLVEGLATLVSIIIVMYLLEQIKKAYAQEFEQKQKMAA